MVGSAERVLVEERNAKNGLLSGRTAEQHHRGVPGEDANGSATFQDVRVTEARNWILRGERIVLDPERNGCGPIASRCKP
jgi:tRNA-2-methylthio-N6-dimethylallyladenosine synthase